MPIHISVDDHLGAISLPPLDGIAHTEIAQAIEGYQSALSASREASQEAMHAERVLRPEATTKDADALATALERGEDDPGQEHTRAADERIADLKRRAEASAIVTRRRLGDVVEALRTHGDDWIADLEREQAEAVEAWAGALDLVAEVHGHLTRVAAMRRFSRTGRYFGASPLTPYVGRAPEIGVDQALAALREFAKPAGSTVEPVRVGDAA